MISRSAGARDVRQRPFSADALLDKIRCRSDQSDSASREGHRAVALTQFDNVAPEDLPEKIRGYRSQHVVVAGDDLEELVPLEEVERRYILRVLSERRDIIARVYFDRIPR